MEKHSKKDAKAFIGLYILFFVLFTLEHHCSRQIPSTQANSSSRS